MEDGRGSSGIGSSKSIGLAEGILLPTEAVESNRPRPYVYMKANNGQCSNFLRVRLKGQLYLLSETGR